jgi:hypothetical protein
MDTLASNESLSGLYERLQGCWTGCDWPTEFGAARLNLQSMTAEQAALLGRATCGLESTQWREAARFLAQIEADAKAAQRAAEVARDHAIASQLHDALSHAQRACDLERRSHALVGWEPLEMAIRQMLADSVESTPARLTSASSVESSSPKSAPAPGVAFFVPTGPRNATRQLSSIQVDHSRQPEGCGPLAELEKRPIPGQCSQF